MAERTEVWNESNPRSPFPPRLRYQRWDGRGQPIADRLESLPLAESLSDFMGRLEGKRTKRVTELRTMPYREYLRTPEWRRTRREAIARAGRRCQLCGAVTKWFDVHHLTYERLGQEESDDLVVLCPPCHDAQHAEDATA